jgi:hypothetical protein
MPRVGQRLNLANFIPGIALFALFGEGAAVVSSHRVR